MRATICIGALALFGLLAPMPIASATPAASERVAVVAAHGESDVADEAAAVTLLVRGALARDADAIVASDDPVALAKASAACAMLHADRVVLLDVARDGIGLRANVAVAAASGALELAYVRAGDGDVAGLAAGIVDRVVALAHVRANAVPTVDLGRLRPYVTALRMQHDARAAAAALEDAIPDTAVLVPAVTEALAPVIAAIDVDHGIPASAVAIAARAVGAVDTLDALAKGKTDAAAPAAALAAIARQDVATAEAALEHAPATPLRALVQATLAERRGDDAKLSTAIEAGLHTDHARAFAALAVTIAPARLATAVHRGLLALAERAGVSDELASRIGAAAAQAGVDRDRALALVSVRDLGAEQIADIEQLLTTRATLPAALRLHAEIAMRRAAADAPAAIAAFAAAEGGQPPQDARAQLYLGWRLASKGSWKEAADSFRWANSRAELVRARLLAGEPYEEPNPAPKELSAEETAELAQHLLDAGHADTAKQRIDEALKAAPLDAIVARVAAAIAAAGHDDATAALARKVVALGTAASQPDVATAQGSDAGSQSDTGSGAIAAELGGAVDPELASALGALLAELPLDRFRKPVIVALPSRSSWLHNVHDDRVPAALAAALTMAHRTPIGFTRTGDDSSIAARISEHDADAAIVYRVDAPSRIELQLFRPSAAIPDEVDGDVPAVATLNAGHLALVGGGLLLVLGIAIAWRRGAARQLDVTIDRAPDASDEVYCISVARHAGRPHLGNLATFHAETKAAGAVSTRHGRTLVGRLTTFKLPAGRWYVNLYGAFTRGGTLRAVPDTASKTVEVRRDRTATVAFDLVPTVAELQVQLLNAGKTATVATTERDKVYADPEGHATLMLPVGNHVLLIEHAGVVTKRPVQVPAPRVQRIVVELNADAPAAVALGSTPAVELAPLVEAVGGLAAPPRTTTSDVIVAFNAPGTRKRPPSGIGPAGTATVADVPAVSRTMTPKRSKPAPAAIMDVERDASAPISAAMPTVSVPGGVGPEPAPAAAATASRPEIKLNLVCKLHEKFLDRYLITAEVGRGAMGIVHRARDEKLERDVAIKQMADELRRYPEAMRLFRLEAKALAQLNHTNIVTMYDQIDDGDHVWMIMEYVDGRTLESILDERVTLPWLEAISIVDQVCAGLAYAHARKVIHRDVKPANVFVARDRIAKLGDFGLARVAREVQNRRTEVRGTPLYMAPEQIKGADVDGRTDLYAVGCTLFEMCTGRPPFIDGDIVYKQVHEPPPTPSSVGGSIPDALERLIMRLIAKAPADRPQSANGVRAAFKDLF